MIFSIVEGKNLKPGDCFIHRFSIRRVEEGESFKGKFVMAEEIPSGYSPFYVDKSLYEADYSRPIVKCSDLKVGDEFYCNGIPWTLTYIQQCKYAGNNFGEYMNFKGYRSDSKIDKYLANKFVNIFDMKSWFNTIGFERYIKPIWMFENCPVIKL